MTGEIELTGGAVVVDAEEHVGKLESMYRGRGNDRGDISCHQQVISEGEELLAGAGAERR